MFSLCKECRRRIPGSIPRCHFLLQAHPSGGLLGGCGRQPARSFPRKPATPKRGGRGLAASLESCRILGMRVDASDYARMGEAILDLARAGQGGRVCVATVHMVMEAWDDFDYQRLVNASEIVTSDGMPLVWGLRALGVREARRAPDLTPRSRSVRRIVFSS